MKNASIDELLRCIEAANKATELHLQLPPPIRAKPNPMLDNLYAAATYASERLSLSLVSAGS